MRARLELASCARRGGSLLSWIRDGPSPAAFMNMPALIIIIAGTGGAPLASCGMVGVERIPALFKQVVSAPPPHLPGRGSPLGFLPPPGPPRGGAPAPPPHCDGGGGGRH